MKWIKASETPSGHYENVCCRRIGEGFWFTAAYDYSKKVYLPKNASGLMFHKPEDIEWLDETPTSAKGKGYSLDDIEKAFTRGYSLGYDGGEQGEGYFYKECWQTYLSSLPPASIERVEIDFNKRLKARIKVTGNTVEVDDAIDGWGDNIDKQRIIITNLPTPPIEQR